MKRIIATDALGREFKFTSIVGAAKELGCHPASISQVLRRVRGKETVHGMKWRYEKK